MKIIEIAQLGIPPILYHSAPKSERESILRHGLLRSKSETDQLAIEQGEDLSAGPYGGIFFSTKPSDSSREFFDTWAVDVRGLHIEPDLTTDWPEDNDPWWVSWDADIPPSRLRLIETTTS